MSSVSNLESLELSNFIPTYPKIQLPHFNQEILEKQEFYELKLDPIELTNVSTKTNEDGEQVELLRHQKFMARFFSPYTSYNVGLIAHEPGTGKTCLITSIIEMNKVNPVTETTKPIALVLVNNDALVVQFKRELSEKCTDVYIPQPTAREKRLGINMSKQTYNARLNVLVSKSYEITTYGSFVNSISKKTVDEIKEMYSNRIIILDEAHGIRIQANKPDTSRIYNGIHRFLHAITNCKVLMLTGTPIWDTADEIAGLMNLVLPRENQLPTGSEFMNTYFDKSGNLIPNKAEELSSIFHGKVSYLRSMNNDVKRDIGQSEPWLQHLKIYPDVLSSFQFKIADRIRNKDIKDNKDEESEEDDDENKDEEKDKGDVFGKNARHSLNFVFPDGSFGSEGFKKYCVKGSGKRKIYDLNPELRKALDVDNGMPNLSKFSTKYASIIDSITEKQNECSFVYNEFVDGSGAILFALCLQAKGYRWIHDVDITTNKVQYKTKDKRFILFTDRTMNDPNKINKILKEFNRPENRYGEYIQVIIGSRLISMGYSFLHIRQIHVTMPHWNMSAMEQAIARGVRYQSLRYLPENERHTNIYLHAAVRDLDTDYETYDIYIYKIAEDKDYKKHQILRLLKESAFDCANNYNRNVLSTDQDGSRDCDYQNCAYECQGIENVDISPEQRDYSTYNLLYTREIISKLVSIDIPELFRDHTTLSIHQIHNLIDGVSISVIIQAINYIIDNQIPIRNEYGFMCYLKEYNNLVYLDYSISTTQYNSNYYVSHPYVSELNTLENSLEIISLANDQKLIMDMCKNPSIALLERMNYKTRILLFETVYAESFDPNKSQGQENVVSILNDMIVENIYELDDATIHMMYSETSESSMHNIVNKLLQVTGNMRQFIPKKNKSGKTIGGHWVTVSPDKENVYIKKLKEQQKKQHDTAMKNNKYGIYGFVSKNDPTKNMRIYIQSQEGQRQRRGIACSSIVRQDFIDIFRKLDILDRIRDIDNYETHKKKFNDMSKEDIKEYIQQQKYNGDMSKLSYSELIKIAIILSNAIDSQSLCSILKEEFKKKKLFHTFTI